MLAKRRARATIGHAIADYLLDDEGSNHSNKTLQWHLTALGLLQSFLQKERGISLVGEVDAPDINAWFAYMRKTPTSGGKVRSERTIQTYARSARAFFHWLVRRETIERNPFDREVFPKVGKPLIRTIEPEEVERLLLASTPQERSVHLPIVLPPGTVLFCRFSMTRVYGSPSCVGYVQGILIASMLLIIVQGKGSKERRIAQGNNCLRNLLYYLDRHWPDEEELTEWGSAEEDHLFLAETRRPLTINGVTLLFARIRKRAGITDKRISPHIFRHSFAIRYLVLGNDPFSLQELLGHEDMTTVKNYMHMNNETIQSQKRKYSPGDRLPTRMPGPGETRRRGYRARGQVQKKREE